MPMQHTTMAERSCLTPETNNTAVMSHKDSPSSNASDRKNRQRLKPWLLERINSGVFPGVEWMDQSQRIFRIPWKHCGRADWREEDGFLYQAWAIHTGRFKEGDKPDWPTWKTRLRCALTKMKPDIVRRKDLDNTEDEENPYRVYQFAKRPGASSGNAGSASPPFQHQQQHTPQSVYSEDSNCLSPSHICPSPCTPSNLQANIPSVVIDSSDNDDAETANVQAHPVPEDEPLTSLASSLGQLSMEGFVVKKAGEVPLDLSMDSNFNSLPESMDTDSLKDAGYRRLCQLVKQEPATVKSEPEVPPLASPQVAPQAVSIASPELMVIVRYRNEEINKVQVSQPQQGCHVLSQPMTPVSQLAQVCIPDISLQLADKPSDQRQVLKMLNALQQGFYIFSQDGDIYIKRTCLASLFTAPANKTLEKAIKVERSQEAKIFDLRNDFLPALALYKKGQGPRPSPEVVIAIGQSFHADDSNPYDLLVLSVTVHYSLAHELIAQNQPDTPSLELSHESDSRPQHVQSVANTAGIVTQHVQSVANTAGIVTQHVQSVANTAGIVTQHVPAYVNTRDNFASAATTVTQPMSSQVNPVANYATTVTQHVPAYVNTTNNFVNAATTVTQPMPAQVNPTNYANFVTVAHPMPAYANTTMSS